MCIEGFSVSAAYFEHDAGTWGWPLIKLKVRAFLAALTITDRQSLIGPHRFVADSGY